MRLREVFRYEIQHCLRSAATWVYALVLFGMAALMTLASHEPDTFINAPFHLTWMAVAASLFGLLVTAGLFGAAAVRDLEAGMDPLLFTTPLTKAEYLGGRFLAALSVNAALLLLIPLGQLAISLIWQAAHPAEVGPHRLAAYLQAFPLLLIPGLLFSSGVLFAVAMLARQVIPVYVGAIVLFISSIVAANYAGAIANPFLSSLVDVSGVATLQGMSRYWTPAEQNAQLIGFPAALVLSRIALVGFAGIALAIVQRGFRFGHDDGGGSRRRRRRKLQGPSAAGAAHPSTNAMGVAELPTRRVATVSIPRVDPSFSRFAWLRQTQAVARRSFTEVTLSRTFLVVLAMGFGLTLLWGWNAAATVFDATVWPTTALIASVSLSDRNVPVILLLIALYTGEMIWKDRDVGVAEIADAAPVSEGVAVLGRFLAVVATLALMVTAFLVAGLTIQVLQGYYHVELGLYLRILYGLNLTLYVLWAALATVIHVVVNQKFVGHLGLIACIIAIEVADQFGVDHHMLLYATGPGWRYSELNGFGPFIRPAVWFRLYWAAGAALLLVVASLLWIRGREPGVLRRLRVARARFGGGLARTAGGSALLALGFGGFIFYNTDVLNDYRTPKNRGAPQAAYEKQFKRFERSPQPTIVSAQIRTELYPEVPAADNSGTLHLVNLTAASIDSVHVHVPATVEAGEIAFDRPASAVLVDEETGFRIYELATPLLPGDAMDLSFEVSWRPRGFFNDGFPTDVVENGTYFHRDLLPMIGYQPILELTDPKSRARFGLPPSAGSSPEAIQEARNHRHQIRNEDYVRVDAVIGTSGDQTALTYGTLKEQWKENGRAYFHYDTETPESFGYSVVSARYAVSEDRWNDVPLRVYHDPAHTENVDRALAGMKAALAFFSEQFGPYPYRKLDFAEVPSYNGGGGSAHPGLIIFSEAFFNTRVGEGDVDEPFYGTAHEVAHTWWGGLVSGGRGVPGQELVTESLANYSAMILTEKTYGPDAGRRVYDTQMGRYLVGHAEQSHEVPVLDVTDQPYIAYRKGAIAMMILRDHIGEERVNAALRAYVERYRDAGPPYPTSRDLYAHLRAATPDSLHALLSDLFETITLWELRATEAAAVRTSDGQYEVTLEVIGRKVRSDSEGRETEAPMDDLVEIGVFAPPAPGEARGEPLYLQKHRIRSGPQTIRITVAREPGSAGVEPYRKLFERDATDNVVAVELGGGGSP